MGSPERSAIDRIRRLAGVTSVYAVGVSVLLQAYVILRGVLTGSIVDVWLAVLPVLWFDLSIAVLLLFFWGLAFGRAPAVRNRAGWRSFFMPDFSAIREGLRSPSMRTWILSAGVGYAFLFAILTGLLVIDPAGTAPSGPSGYPFLEVFDAPLGWGPRLVWAPNPFVAVILRPYTGAVMLLLAVLGGFGIGLLGHLLRGPRSARSQSAAGAVAGLLVMCPACAVSPTFAIFAGLLTPPAAGTTASVAGLALGPLMALSTAMLAASATMLWIGIARASQGLTPIKGMIPSMTASQLDRRRNLGRWALISSMILAYGALLSNLSAVPPAPSPHDFGHGSPIAETALGSMSAGVWLAGVGTVATAAGVWLILTSGPRLNRAAALGAALVLMYVDGVLHWFAVVDHIGSAPEATFFLLSGAMLVLAVPIVIRRETVLWWVGVAFTGLLLALYAFTRFVPPPVGLQPEPLEPLGLLSKSAEAGVLVALALYFRGRIVSARLADAVVRGPPFAVLLLAVLASDAIIGVEATWGFLPLAAFLLAALLLIALVVCAALAHVRRTKPFVGLTWAIALALIGLNVAQAQYFAIASLTLPVVLCVTSALLLGAPLLFPGNDGRTRASGSVAA